VGFLGAKDLRLAPGFICLNRKSINFATDISVKHETAVKFGGFFDLMKLRFKYPNIADMLLFSATFHMEGNYRSRWLQFWDYVGARNRRPSKFECCVCGCPLRKRGNVKHRVCLKHSGRYLRDVKAGLCLPALYENLEAAY